MCSVDLAAIAEECGTNTAGNKFLYLANEDDLLNVPAVDLNTRTISTDITLQTGKQFFSYGFTEDSCQMTENVNDNDALIGAISCFFKKDEAVKRHKFNEMVGGRYAIIITDNNTVTKLVRNATWRFDYDSGQDPENDQNGYTGRFSYKGEAAYIYTGAVPLTPAQ